MLLYMLHPMLRLCRPRWLRTVEKVASDEPTARICLSVLSTCNSTILVDHRIACTARNFSNWLLCTYSYSIVGTKAMKRVLSTLKLMFHDRGYAFNAVMPTRTSIFSILVRRPALVCASKGINGRILWNCHSHASRLTKGRIPRDYLQLLTPTDSHVDSFCY